MASPDQRATGEPASSEAALEVRDLHIRRGRREVFRGLSCRFPLGRISVVLGGSGSGKSTLLRMIGCLLKPDRGEIWIGDGIELTRMPTGQTQRYRHIVGMMFQHGALLDSMSVYDNVALPLREHTRRDEAEIAREVRRVFESVGLEGVDDLLPAQLSGGMMKRAALARALVMAPQFLLCDEPFSGLDPRTVRLVENLLVDANRRLGVTMIIASHHIASTLRMADHVVMLVDKGAVSGTPDELKASRDPRVIDFFADELPRATPGAGSPRDAATAAP